MTYPLPLDVQKIIDLMMVDRAYRLAVARQSHFLFFIFYFSRYLTVPLADFQKEIISLTEASATETLILMAFRESGKSTIVTLSYLLWSIFGIQKKHCAVLVSQTQEQSRHFTNCAKSEIEKNDLLRSDFGPFREDEEWRSTSLILPDHDAKILAISPDQPRRGVKHNQYRPDLIIFDDVENTDSTRTAEGRERTWRMVFREIIPMGTDTTRLVFLGNFLHRDGLLSRLMREIDAGERPGTFRRYPFLDEAGNPLWPERYPTAASIEAKRRQVDPTTFEREYMLRDVAEMGQILTLDDIHYYDVLPKEDDYWMCNAIGVDPAVSERGTADCTGVVCAHLRATPDGKRQIYILPNFVNERLSPGKTKERVKLLALAFNCPYVYVEDVAAQRIFVDWMREEGLNASGVPVHGQNKLERLVSVAHFIEAGFVLFPRTGAEPLINQLLAFGDENHEDLADAIVILLLGVAIHMKPIGKLLLA